MLERALCPTLVGRDQQLFVLEDALLAAQRGESRFVAVGGEAGVGKTRLVTELAKRARALGCQVLWGACSEVELPLPYLPIVEALGNYISGEDPERLAAALGGARRELAQLFPQLADEPSAGGGEPGQAKLRLFEAVVALLAIPAREHGLVLVLEDVHWADAATRELLDHLARRLTNTRSLLVVTYRDDELDRRHPLRPLLQTWRRSGVVEVVTLSPLEPAEVGEMIGAIVGEDVGSEFPALMHVRTDGNPFVLEEMLKEVLDRGGLVTPDGSGAPRSPHELDIPATVRDTILSRLARLAPDQANVLEAAAVLGRTFDYGTLVAVTGASEATVREALSVGVAQQLLEEADATRASYRWRHALTQEAVADEIVLPRRQEIHSRAADAATAAGGSAVDVARHLLEAARFDEAVPVCITASEEAEASLAFAEAVELLERALPHTRDALVHARVLCRMGRLLWMQGKTPAAEAVLVEGVPALEAAGDELEAARHRLVLARCYWEQSRPADSHAEFERARSVLERHGPSADLAVAYIRLSGLYKFEFDAGRSLAAAEKAVEVARLAGADFERVWALSWLGYALEDVGRFEEGRRLVDEAFDEARRRGFAFIAHNIAYNDAWTRLHTMTANVDERLLALAAEPGPAAITNMTGIAASWAARARGELSGALASVRRAEDAGRVAASEKVHWRARVELAEVLLELGRLDEAWAALPPTSQRAELQDLVYDAGPQIRVRLATGRVDEAVTVAREIAEQAERIARYPDALALAVEAFLSAELVDEAQALVAVARAHTGSDAVLSLDEAEGRILLVRGEFAQARAILEATAREAGRRGFRLAELRLRTLAAEAFGQSGTAESAERELAAIVSEADKIGAALIRDAARATAERLGIALAAAQTQRPDGEASVPPVLPSGERLVTSMFVDVRGYTRVAATTPPAQLADRIETLYRWASAEVGRHHGFVDKFAGDAVMATFNATGTRLDHTRDAVESAFAIAGKAAMLGLGVGVGIAVGPAVVGRASTGANVSVLGTTTNLAARLQTAADAGEVVLSEEAHRRVADWLAERGLEGAPAELELKGFDERQRAWRLRAVRSEELASSSG